MDTALTIIISVTAPGVLSLIGAIFLGKLVPSSRVVEAERRAEKYKLAYEEKSAAFISLEQVVQRQAIVTETVNQVLTALKQTAQTSLPPEPRRGEMV